MPRVLHREHESGRSLIPQSSHAWLAWQLASRWGNRRFVRPAPGRGARGGLLHDWAGPSSIDPGRLDWRPVTFDRMPGRTSHLAPVRRPHPSSATPDSRGDHFTALVERKTQISSPRRHGGAGPRRRSVPRWSASRPGGGSRSADARYQPYLDGPRGRQRALLEAAIGCRSSLRLPGLVFAVASGGSRRVPKRRVAGSRVVDGGTRWRLRPRSSEG